MTSSNNYKIAYNCKKFLNIPHFFKKLLTIFGKMIKYWLNLFGRFISMIKLIDEIITDYSKKLSARNQYYTNTIYSCFYSCSNKNNILKSVSVKTL